MSKTYYLFHTIPLHNQTHIQCHSKFDCPILFQCKDAFQIQSTSVGPLKMLASNNQVFHSCKMHHQCYSISLHQFEWQNSCFLFDSKTLVDRETKDHLVKLNKILKILIFHVIKKIILQSFSKV